MLCFIYFIWVGGCNIGYTEKWNNMYRYGEMGTGLAPMLVQPSALVTERASIIQFVT